MAKLTTDTSWTETLAAGTYDIQIRGAGEVYVGRGTTAPSGVDDAMHISGSAPLRLSVKAGDTAYFFGSGVEVYYYAAE